MENRNDSDLEDCPQSGFTYNPDMGTEGTKGTKDYISVRVTCPHIDVRRMLAKIFDGIEYICYLHKGKKTHKEHCHVLVPDDDSKVKEKIKKRLVREGFKGNESYSIKGYHNGITKGIQYASNEGTEPICFGDFDELIANAPKWQQQSIHSHFQSTDKPDRTLRDWQLTYTNLVPQAVHFAKVNKMGDATLKEVVKSMLTTTKWRPNKHMIQGGVPEFYSNDFQFRMGHRKEPDMDWFCLRA